MPYTPDRKEKTHRRIVESASKEFRAHGFEGVGIANLMGGLRLTHGGFYAHFADKEALVAEASAAALDQSVEMMLDALKVGGFPAMLDYYLSEGHRDHPALGCPLPALTAELARHSAPTREAFTERLSEAFRAIAEYMPGRTRAQKHEKVGVVFASMAGAVSLARTVSDPALSASILRSTRDHLLRFIDDTQG